MNRIPALLLASSIAISSLATSATANAADTSQATLKVMPVEVDADYQASVSEIVDVDDYTTTYANPDGSNTTFVSLLPTNIEVNGEWQPATDELVVQGGAITAPEHPLDPTFGDDAAGGVTASWRGSDVEFTLRGADNVEAEAENGGDTVSYDDALPQSDLEYQFDD